MTDLKDIVFETEHYWVKRVPKGFEVYKTGLTHSTRVASIGYTGDKGLQRAKDEIARRETASGTDPASSIHPSERRHATKKSPAQLQREIDEALAGAGASSAFEEAKAESALIEKEVDAADEVLQAFPKGPMGGVRDDVRSTPEFRAANTRFQKAFARQRAFNAVYVKRFAKELRAERDKRYGRSS
jgi:hypothetical protein